MVYWFSQFCGLGDYLARFVYTHVAHSADKLAGLQGPRRFYSPVWQLMLLVGVLDSFPHDSLFNNKLNTFSYKSASSQHFKRANLKMKYLLRSSFKICMKSLLPPVYWSIHSLLYGLVDYFQVKDIVLIAKELWISLYTSFA